MSAVLTYHVRAGHLSAFAAGRIFDLPTHKVSSRVASWEKVQELRPGKHTLWDHCFEPPQQRTRGLQSFAAHRMSAATVIQRVNLGSASTNAAQLGVFDWPGAYAQRFDGVDNRPGGQHNHPGSAICVGDRRAGIYIHGWPPCNLQRCVVVLPQWDDLMRAVASEAELSFAIEV